MRLLQSAQSPPQGAVARLTVILVTALLLGASGQLHAQEEAGIAAKEERARALVRDANAARQAAIDAGDTSAQGWVQGFERAAALLREIVAVAPSAPRLYGLAFALFHLDEVELAHRACARLEAEFFEDERMLHRCEALMAVLHDVVFRVDLRSEPTGARVSVDGWPAEEGVETPGQLWLREGRHTLRFRRAGYLEREQEVIVEPGFVTQVRARLDKEPEPGHLELRVSPAGASVSVDGQPVTLPMDGIIEVLEGERVLRVSMEGFVPVEQRLTIAAHKLLRHTVKLPEMDADDPYLRGGFPGGETRGPRRRTNPYVAWGWTAVGLGAASLVTGGTMHALAYLDAEDASAMPNLPGRRGEFLGLRDDARLKETVAYALYGVGAAALTTGVLLLVLDPARQGGETVVTPTALGGDGAGLFLTGRF